MIVTLWRH